MKEQNTGFPVPVLNDAYINVYKPAGDVYRSDSVAYLQKDTYYESWIPNDFCITELDGRWHLFGITHPAPPDYTGGRFDPATIHAGEWQLFHAVSPKGSLTDVWREGCFEQQPQILPTCERPGERPEIWAPDITRLDSGDYLLAYTPDPFRAAVSSDLYRFTLKGKLFTDGTRNARDINILRADGEYLCTYCSPEGLALRRTKDFVTFTEPVIIKRDSENIALESPVLRRIFGHYYLFVCPYDGNGDDAYCHKTYVYAADSPEALLNAPLLTVLDAHAPEVAGDGDTWMILSVEWPCRGVSMTKLSWKNE